MREILLSCVIFILASTYVLLLSYFAGSSFMIQRTIVLPILIVLLLIYSTSFSSWRELINNVSRWIILATFTIFIQLIIISSGGIKSPFLIFIHLFTIGISLIFSFSVSLLFLLASFIIIAIDISFRQNLLTLLLNDPYTTILQIFSLIPIIPVSYIISQHYHFKDKLSKTLHAQVIRDETILANLEELIIITDTKLRILSVNDAVEKTIQKSDSEMIGQSIFEILLLMDNKGKLINKETFLPNDKSQPKNISDEFILINSRLPKRRIHLLMQPIKDPENNINQISFIISNVDQKDSKKDTMSITLNRAKTKYDAISEKIKQELLNNSLSDVRMEIILLEKIQNDMYMLQTLKDDLKNNYKTRVDVSQLCKQTIFREQDFASGIKVPIEFKILDFGIKDIAPLTAKNFPIRTDNFTGPFFTVLTDIKRFTVIIKKLLDIGIFLASTETNPFTSLTIQKDNKNIITIKITSSCLDLSEEELVDITHAYYNKLYNKTNLHIGSGLEGYLAKTLCDELHIPLDIKHKDKTITFSLSLKKANTL